MYVAVFDFFFCIVFVVFVCVCVAICGVKPNGDTQCVLGGWVDVLLLLLLASRHCACVSA